jgi:hypothetical protein
MRFWRAIEESRMSLSSNRWMLWFFLIGALALPLIMFGSFFLLFGPRLLSSAPSKVFISANSFISFTFPSGTTITGPWVWLILSLTGGIIGGVLGLTVSFISFICSKIRGS